MDATVTVQRILSVEAHEFLWVQRDHEYVFWQARWATVCRVLFYEMLFSVYITDSLKSLETRLGVDYRVTRRENVIRLVQFGWIAAVAAVLITAYSGNATAYITPSQLPAGGTGDAGGYIFGGILVIGFGGAAVIGLLGGSSWKGMQKETDLVLTDSGLLSNGQYVGTVRGRQVRARTEKRRTGQSTEGGSKTTTYSITEADLASPTDLGIIISKNAGGAGQFDVEDTSVEQTVINGEFVVTGVDSQLARELLTADVQDAIRVLDDGDNLTLGSAAETVMGEMPDMSDSSIGGYFEGKLKNAMARDIGGSATTVAIETKGKLGDATELNGRIAAVAAVADAFEASQQ